MRYSDIQISRRPGDPEPQAKKRTEDPWITEALPELLRYAATLGQPFITDDFFEDTGVRRPDNPKLLGSLTTKASGFGWIRKTGRSRTSKRAERHGGILNEWEVTETGLKEWAARKPRRRLVRIGESNGNSQNHQGAAGSASRGPRGDVGDQQGLRTRNRRLG